MIRFDLIYICHVEDKMGPGCHNKSSLWSTYMLCGGAQATQYIHAGKLYKDHSFHKEWTHATYYKA